MGMLGDAFKRALVDQLGEQWWEHNLSVVESVWTAIEKALEGLNLRYELVRVLPGRLAGQRPRAADS